MTRGHHTLDNTDAGFSLLEMIIALAILSLVSLASYQSLAQLTGLSARAGAATERTVETVLTRAVFTDLVAGIVPGWRGESQAGFIGGPTGFTAQSGRVPGQSEGLTAFALRTTDAGLILATTDTTTRLSASPATLAYLGTDGLWRDSWPPDTPIPFGPATLIADTPAARDHLLGAAPLMPAAIRVDFATGFGSRSDRRSGRRSGREPGRGDVWFGSLDNDPDLPATSADIAQ